MDADSENDQALQLLQAIVGVLSVVEDYLFAWRLHPDGTIDAVFESREIVGLLGGEDGRSPLDLLLDVVHLDDYEALDRLLAAVRAGEPEVRGQFRIRREDDASRTIVLRVACTPLAAGAFQVEGILKDCGSPDQLQDELTTMLAHTSTVSAQLEEQNILLEVMRGDAERQSRVDAMTECFNRRHFLENLEREIERSTRDRSFAGALLLDVDKFKSVNDTYGHPAGDAVLIAVAARLRAAVREYDTVARYGGEEFAVLLPGVAADDVLLDRAEEIRAVIGAEPILLPDGTALTVTASCGAALWSSGLSADALLDAADRALYAAKRSGRNRTRLFASLTDDDVAAEEPEALKLARGLALAASIREASAENHCQEVADLAAAIAAELGLAEAEIMRCRLGGWLHDVGKLAVPDRVLHADGPLDEADRDVLHAHVELGADIVSRMTGLRDAVHAVRHHHERFDGSGYPDGLSGAAIPIDARIVAAADAFSAIRAGRAYQPALPEAETLERLRASAGVSLDPDVVEALLRVTSGRAAPAGRAESRSAAR